MQSKDSEDVDGLSGDGYFSPDALCHPVAYLFGVVVVRLEEHEFGDGALNGGVVAADDTGLLQLVARVVAAHFNTSLHALADVDDNLAVMGGFA